MSVINYNKLKGRVIECGYTFSTFAVAMGLTPPSIRAKLNGKSHFTADEIVRVCKLLGITSETIFDYFFTELVH